MGCLGSKEAEEEEIPRKKEKKEKLHYKWSYDCTEDKAWKMPDKEAFIARFENTEGEGTAKEKMLRFLAPTGLVGEKRVYLPGELDGYDVSVENCNKCDFYLFDNTSQVQIDDCTDCRFFVAPCSGPVFLRNSKNCTVVVAAAQIRLRDCKDCTLMMLVPRRAVLEECKGTKVSCWNVSYFQLAVQLARAKISAFDNGWYNWDDYGTNSAPTILPAGTTVEELMGKGGLEPWQPLHEAAPGVIEGPGEVEPAVPLTTGILDAIGCFVLISPQKPAIAATIASHFSGGKGGAALAVAANREVGPLSEQDLQRLFSDLSKFGKGQTAKARRALFGKGPVIGLVLSGAAGAGGIVRSLLRDSGTCILGGIDADLSPDFNQGQVFIWEGGDAKSAAIFILNEIRVGLDG